MKFSKRRKEILSYIGIYTVVFILMCLLVFQQFWSEGRSFVWQIDGWNQHYKALQFYSDWLQGIVRNLVENHQLAIPLWSQCIGFGSDIVTTLHYYVIGDPLCLLSVFVPDRYMVNFYDGMILLRLYLAGLAFGAFCCCRRNRNVREGHMSFSAEDNRKDRLIAITGMLAASMIYLFSAYALVMGLHHPYFLNPMIYLPLMLIGVEKILEKKSPALFIAMVCLSAVSNFYFFYIIGCNVIVYVLIRLFTRYGLRRWKKLVGNLMKIAGYAVTGACLAGVMLIPVLNLLSRTARISRKSGIELFYEGDFYKNLPVLFFTSTPTLPHHTAMVFSFVAFFCLLLLFMERKKHLELKAAFLTLTAVACLPLMGKIFHGFAYSSNRWMFGYVLLVACIVSAEWRTLFSLSTKKLAVLAVSAAAAGGYLLWRREIAVTEEILFILAFMAVGICVLALPHMEWRHLKAGLSSVIMLVLVAASVGTNAFYNFSERGNNRASEYRYKEVVRTDLNAPVDTAVKKIAGDDVKEARYSAAFDLIERNSTLKSGLMSTHFYWSLADKLPAQFFKEMGVNNKTDYTYRGLDGRTVLNTLAGVKYYVVQTGDTDSLPYGYVKKGSCQIRTNRGQKSYSVYENQFALPLGYTYDSYMDRETYEKMNEQDKEKGMLQSVLLEKDLPGYKKKSPEPTSRVLSWEIEKADGVSVEGRNGGEGNSEDASQNGIRFRVKKANASITLKLMDKIPDAETAVMVKGLEYKGQKRDIRQINLRIDGESGRKHRVQKRLTYLTPRHVRYSGRKDYLIHLGWSEKGRDEITIYFPRRGRYSTDKFQVLGQTMKGYAEETAARKENVLENMEIGTNRISGQIHLSENKILCLAFPYSTGWTAWVDGEKTEILQANTMFMAIPLEKGSHDIVLTYRTPGLTMGIGFSALGAALCVIIAVKRRYNRIKML